MYIARLLRTRSARRMSALAHGCRAISQASRAFIMRAHRALRRSHMARYAISAWTRARRDANALRHCARIVYLLLATYRACQHASRWCAAQASLSFLSRCFSLYKYSVLIVSSLFLFMLHVRLIFLSFSHVHKLFHLMAHSTSRSRMLPVLFASLRTNAARSLA